MNSMKLAYLGPPGTFTQQAALLMQPLADAYPFANIRDVIYAIQRDEADAGVIPLENSTEGLVNTTVDTFIFDCNLYIQQQIVVPITHNLMVREGNKGRQVEKVLSHYQALAQCREYIAKHYPGAEIKPTSSTAEAAKLVGQTEAPWAAIGTELAGKTYGLHFAATHIQDQKNNETKFILVSKDCTCQPTGGQTLSIAFSTHNKPGELYKVLSIFALLDVNMTSISSRPMKDANGQIKLGEHVFWVDLEVSRPEKDVEDALTMVKRKVAFYKPLGCYDTTREGAN